MQLHGIDMYVPSHQRSTTKMTSSAAHQVEFTTNSSFLQRPCDCWPNFAQVLLCIAGSACLRRPASRADRRRYCQKPQLHFQHTSVLWEEDSKRTLLKDPRWIVIFCELWDCPVINALMVPGLVFFVLQSVEGVSAQIAAHLS